MCTLLDQNGQPAVTMQSQSPARVQKNTLFVELEVLLQDQSVNGLSLEDSVTRGPPAWMQSVSNAVKTLHVHSKQGQ